MSRSFLAPNLVVAFAPMHTHAVVLIDENKAMCWNSVQNNRACIGRTMLAIEALVQFEQIAQMAKKS
jgi:hypothetical protein